MLLGIARCAACGGSMCYYRQQWRAKNRERMYPCYFNHVPSYKSKLLGAKFQRQLQAYEAGALDLNDLKAARERLNADRRALQSRLSALESRQNSRVSWNIALLRERIRSVLASASDPTRSPEDRRHDLRRAVDHIEYPRRQDVPKIVFRLG